MRGDGAVTARGCHSGRIVKGMHSRRGTVTAKGGGVTIIARSAPFQGRAASLNSDCRLRPGWDLSGGAMT